MENSPANQLPEVDSLPDGFVESSAEPVTPRTPTVVERESEPEEDYKDPYSLSDSLAEDDVRITGVQMEKVTEKQRTFPVTLSERDGDSLEETSSKGNVVEEDRECGSMVAPATVSEGGSVVASQNELTMPMGPSHEHQHAEATVGCSELKADDLKQSSAQGNAESHNNRKLETSDVKRKSVKRGFKTEREFLEFTLKYQQVIAERDAAITIRDKLESLCRELQRQNKMLMEECKRVSSEGQNMRLELSTKFHDAIKDVGIKLDEQKDECLSQLKENEMLRNKLKHLSDQYSVSEQQFTQKLKQKSLELQIADLKLQQHEEKLTHEQSQMKLYAEQVSQLLATEKNLRLQLAADGEKFQQFQDALLKSNEVFETFKQEIEKMAKSIKELKKENVFLKGKCERTDITLIELVGEREHMKKQLEKMKNQKEKLESLCRSLQAERKQNSVGSSNNDPVPLSSRIGTAVEPKVEAAESNIGTTEEES